MAAGGGGAGVWRAPLHSRRDDVDRWLAVERALALGLCGTGGRLVPPPASLDEALRRTAEEYDDRAARRLERFAAVADGAEVWTRDADGLFHHGVMAGPWRYDADPAAYDADLVHVRPCRWDPAPLAEPDVPPAVVATFGRGGRNFQRIRAL